MTPKFPNVKVKLINHVSGNAFAILGAVKSEMRKQKVDQKDIDAFVDEATAGDYNHLLRTVMETVEVR